MTKDINVTKLIKCAEIHNDVNAKCIGCDYIDYGDCVDAMLRDAITIIKAGYREACKVENRPIDERKRVEPTSMLVENRSMKNNYISRRYISEKWDNLKWHMEYLLDEAASDEITQENVKSFARGIADNMDAIRKELGI